VARAAARRGLTHLAVTDHDRIDAALRLRDTAPPELTIIVGEEVKTADGDLIAVFLREAVPPGMSAVETIAAVREQGGLVGVPHPFDGLRGFGRKSGAVLESIAHLVDWVEAYNARVVGGSANEKAALFAREHGLPGVGASDSHTVLEVGVTYNIVTGDPGTPEGLVAGLSTVDFRARTRQLLRARLDAGCQGCPVDEGERPAPGPGNQGRDPVTRAGRTSSPPDR